MHKTGRNDLCPCGSGRKFKHCHEGKGKDRQQRLLMIVVGATVLLGLIVGASALLTERPGGTGLVWDPAHGHYHDAAGREVR